MTTKTRAVEPAQPPPAPLPVHIGQATAIEQSRAVAEVQAAVVVAQQCPRSLPASIAAMRESCAQKGLAERAFFRFPRGGTNVSGPSVHLARDLARCWGNIQYNISELRRDDAAGISEMLAWAWDVQTNTRASHSFIVPHRRDKKVDGKSAPEALVDLRDIYENNANNGARRLRECIFAVLPPWFVEEAKDLCANTLKGDGSVPLARRVADAVKGFDGLGVTVDRIEQKLGRPSGKWTDHDLATLGVIFKSVQRGEVTLDEEFPPQRVTAEEITRAVAEPAPQNAAESGGWPETAQPPKPKA